MHINSYFSKKAKWKQKKFELILEPSFSNIRAVTHEIIKSRCQLVPLIRANRHALHGSSHHHHHIVLAARISLTLSRHSSLSFIALGRSSGQQPVSSHSCWMYVRAGRPAFARPCVGIHKSTSLMSSSLLLQQCPACLVRLCTLTKRLEKKLDGNYTRMLRAILNKSWQQHPTRHQLYGHLPPITKTIQVTR